MRALLLAAAIVTGSRTADAASFLIDFGVGGSTTTGQAVTWNNFTGTTNGDSLLNLLDIDGLPSPYDLTYTGTAKLNTLDDNNATTVRSDTPAPFDVNSVIIDSFYHGSAVTFTLSDLDPQLTYNFTFYGYVNRTGTRLTQFSITGHSPVTIEPASTDTGGRGGVASINNVSPDPTGNIVFTVKSGASTNWILNAAQITSVPEPSTALLGLTGAAIFFGARRRRA